MEFVDGQSITEFCEDQGLTINERVALFAEACDGVAFVHEHGILHREIKPGNLIVDEASGDPTVKLIDFGIARCNEFDELGLVVGQTLDGASMGTRDYSSPEQIDGKHSESAFFKSKIVPDGGCFNCCDRGHLGDSICWVPVVAKKRKK